MSKQLKGYDLEHLISTWQALLHDPVMTVQPLCVNTSRLEGILTDRHLAPCRSSDPHLVLARMASSRDQFAVYDVRRPATSPAILTFGYDLARRFSVLLCRPAPSPPVTLTPTHSAPIVQGSFGVNQHGSVHSRRPVRHHFRLSGSCAGRQVSPQSSGQTLVHSDVDSHLLAGCGICATSARRRRPST